MRFFYALSLFGLLYFSTSVLQAAPLQTTYQIRIDQFGYFPNARKIAIIVDPQTGFNGAESFLPGTGSGQYQVRKWSDDAVVFSGTLQAWNNGSTQAQSGDRGWWFDFSSVTASGSYYLFDLANNVGSFRFEISDNVYDEVLKQTLRTFFYQRINFAKQSPYTDARWSDGACFEGALQDHYATSRYAKGDMATARDLSGGWMDAGDKNKYTTFAHDAVIQLLEAYRINPNVFKDNYNIPESGNGIPDLLDEVKWELDFLKRMQEATGTQGFLLKVGTDNYNEITPPSADTRPRYYVPECTSATIAGCSIFAVAGVVFNTVPALSSYGQDLITRAEAAWSRAKSTTASFTNFQANCDDGDIKSGDADQDARQQLDNAFVAAVYLYEATGKAEYKTFIESQYTKVYVYSINWWGPYWMPQQLALLRVLTLPNISATVINNIRNQKANMSYLYSYPTYEAGTDLYRAHMENDAYHWGHNQARTGAGHLNLDFITFNINTTNQAKYRMVAEQYLHWMHGVNPMGMVMLSNMYSYGAERCANEIYHTWFANGSAWDNALTSSKGPAPGYVPGGPNKNYTGSLTYLNLEPPAKAYKDWNNDWPENSWEITEPSIYCQASYIMLLSRLMSPSSGLVDTEAPTAPSALTATNITSTDMQLKWTAANDNVGVSAYELYSGANLINGAITGTSYTLSGLACATSYSLSLKARDAAGNVSATSNIITPQTSACPSGNSDFIYTDHINTDWTDNSTACTVSPLNTAPVKNGTKSLKAQYSAYGKLLFVRSAPVNASSLTKLRFWVYNTGKNGLKVYTHNSMGVKSTDYFYKPGSNKWIEVIISLSQLGNPTTFSKVTIENNAKSGGTMYFDDIQLTGVTLTGLTTTSTRTASGPETISHRIKLFPNPAHNRVTVLYQSKDPGKANIELMDISGRIISRQMREIHEGINQWDFYFPGQQPGIYYLCVKEGGQVTLQPLSLR